MPAKRPGSASNQVSPDTTQKRAGLPHAVLLAANHGAFSAEPRYWRGRYMEGQGRHEQASAAYQEALRRDPRMVEAYTGFRYGARAGRLWDMLAGAICRAVTAREQAQRLDQLVEVVPQIYKLLRIAARSEPPHVALCASGRFD